MNRSIKLIFGTLLIASAVGFWNGPIYAAPPPPVCKTLHIDGKASKPFANVTLPPAGTCTPKTSRGFLIPDPKCSPGAVNPTVTLAILKTKGFTTKCLRDQATTPTQKAQTYAWYKIKKPAHNAGKTQTCELDHIISLELGGADTLENIWPQCGPAGVALTKRFFKQKDAVENFLAAEVRAGRISMADAQKGVAEDWTQFLDAARKPAKKGKK